MRTYRGFLPSAKKRIGLGTAALLCLATLTAIGDGDTTDAGSSEEQRRSSAKDGNRELAPLPVDYPNPAFVDGPRAFERRLRELGLRLDRERFGKIRPEFLAPKETKPISHGKPVRSSDPFPNIGNLELVTDGEKDSRPGHFVELAPGKQHTTIDLQKRHRVDALLLWHRLDHRVYRDVIVQLANDPEFPADQTVTVFSTDRDNSAGLGRGKDHNYIETFQGLLVANYERKDDKLMMTEPLGTYRYVRCWSNGSTADEYNHYTEVEVWGRPANGDSARK